MNRKKKVVSFIGMCAILLTVPVASFANNHSDTNFHFVFGGFLKQDETISRPKFDNSSAYIKMTSRSKDRGFDAKVIKDNGSDVGSSSIYVGNIGSDYYIRNNAYKMYGRAVEVKIKAEGNGWTSYTADGVWSPDSV